MQLPFSEREFLDVFGAYNSALWPVAAVLWVASLVVFVLVLRGSRIDRSVSLLLAVHWAWAGIAYHLAFFASINPAARIFAAMFLLEAILLAWAGLGRGAVRYVWERSPWRMIGAALAAYSLAYPPLAMALVQPYPRTPTFGVPCPTTIFTIGLLMMSTPARWWPALVPLLWTVIGGSAAVLFGVTTDFVLPVAGALLLAHLIRYRSRDRQPGDRHRTWRDGAGPWPTTTTRASRRIGRDARCSPRD